MAYIGRERDKWAMTHSEILVQLKNVYVIIISSPAINH